MQNAIRELNPDEIVAVAGGGFDDFCGTRWRPTPPGPWIFGLVDFNPLPVLVPLHP